MIDNDTRHAYLETEKRSDETSKALCQQLDQIRIGMPSMSEEQATTGVLQ
jgi:hypothetical protein